MNEKPFSRKYYLFEPAVSQWCMIFNQSNHGYKVMLYLTS